MMSIAARIRRMLAAGAFLALGACETVGVDTVEQIDLMLDCYFLPVDRAAVADGQPLRPSDRCSRNRIGKVAALSGTAGSILAETASQSDDYRNVLTAWESRRKLLEYDSAEARKLRILRGYFIYAYLAKFSADEALSNATEAQTVAARIVTPLRRGLSVIDTIAAVEDPNDPNGGKGADTPAAAFRHTLKAETFFDGFEAAYEARAATFNRMTKFVRSFQDIVVATDLRQKVREGVNFAYDAIKRRAYASALQFDLVITAINVTEVNGKTLTIRESLYDARLKGVRARINEHCLRLAITAALPKEDQVCTN